MQMSSLTRKCSAVRVARISVHIGTIIISIRCILHMHTTDALFALRVEKYREGQNELHCVFVDLEKAYDKVPRFWIGRKVRENSTR